MMDLQNKAKQINNGGIDFMDSREKADLILGEVLEIDDFGFIKSEDGEYVVISTSDYPKFFFFGGTVITAKIKELIDGEDLSEIKEVLKTHGLPTIFFKQKSKNKREYTTCLFYPTSDDLKEHQAE